MIQDLFLAFKAQCILENKNPLSQSLEKLTPPPLPGFNDREEMADFIKEDPSSLFYLMRVSMTREEVAPIIKVLHENENDGVLGVLARNPALAQMTDIAQDLFDTGRKALQEKENYEVLLALARNPAIAQMPEIIENLFKTSDPEILNALSLSEFLNNETRERAEKKLRWDIDQPLQIESLLFG